MLIISLFYVLNAGLFVSALRLPPHSPRNILSALRNTNLLDTDASVTQEVRKWHLLTQNTRPDDVYVSKSSTVEATADFWKMVLISLRVLEKDPNAMTHTAVMTFPHIPIGDENLALLRSYADTVETSINSSSYIFQPNQVRKMSILPLDSTKEPKGYACSMVTTRSIPVAISYDDLDSYVPPIEDIVTNDIPNFPFDTVFDFIAEINRPIDKVSMSTLRFKYSTLDLKFDVEKVKTKKDPQEMVDNINCKLTRLATWRDILVNVSDGPDFFSNEMDWSTKVKLRYQSMRALINNSENAKLLDTQYDKKKTFIKIIDQWSDRLKRNFKFIYFSQREPIDFAKQIMASKWRIELVNTTSVLSKVPILNLEGPHFIPGAPAPIFGEERQAFWPYNYEVEYALMEMLEWSRSVDKVKARVGLSLIPVTRIAFVRDWFTEGVMLDTWSAVLDWTLRPDTPAPIVAPRELLASLSLVLGSEDSTDDVDHTGAFITALSKVNAYVRDQSGLDSKAVKVMFKDWIAQGKAFVAWFTDLVRDLDLTERMESMEFERVKPWSELIENMLSEELDTNGNENALDPEGMLAQWKAFKPVLLHAEYLESQMPWKVKPDRLATLAAVRGLGNFKEVVSVVDIPTEEPSPSEGLVVVAPRYFRGQDVKEEYEAFLDFTSLVIRNVEGASLPLRVVPLHPKCGDLLRRAPHPALLFVRIAN